MDIEIKGVKAYNLEPGKVYLLEADQGHVSEAMLVGLRAALAKLDIKLFIVMTRGGNRLRLLPPDQEKDNAIS